MLIKIDWDDSYSGTDPSIHIYLDGPFAPDFRFIEIPLPDGTVGKFLFAESKGFVKFRIAPDAEQLKKPFNAGGLGGNFKMVDGTTKAFNGCWSSNSAFANKLANEFGLPHSKEVTIHENNSKYGFGAIAMTVSKLKELIQALPEQLAEGNRPAGKPILLEIDEASKWDGPYYTVGIKCADGTIWVKDNHMMYPSNDKAERVPIREV